MTKLFFKRYIADKQLTISNTSAEDGLDANLLFRRFFRPSEKVKGNGLGLAIVKAICDYHGWQISYAYKSNKHHFIVQFPWKYKHVGVLSAIDNPLRRTPQRKPKRLKYSDVSVFCILGESSKSVECRGGSTTKPLPILYSANHWKSANRILPTDANIDRLLHIGKGWTILVPIQYIPDMRLRSSSCVSLLSFESDFFINLHLSFISIKH